MRFNLFALATIALAAGHAQAADPFPIPSTPAEAAADLVSRFQAATAVSTKLAEAAVKSVVRAPSHS
jgi:hypothetical protein